MHTCTYNVSAVLDFSCIPSVYHFGILNFVFLGAELSTTFVMTTSQTSATTQTTASSSTPSTTEPTVELLTTTLSNNDNPGKMSMREIVA